MYNDDFLKPKLEERSKQMALRKLQINPHLIDFCSNDYLGIATNRLIKVQEHDHGSKGSRLLSGHHEIMQEVENELAIFHNAHAALLFNSGYDANVGLLSAVAKKGDTIVYDALSHASIRDGIRLSFAQSYAFTHNNLEDLEKKLQHASGNIFVLTESVFSMDGDLCPLNSIIQLCEKYHAHLIIDEAHATGVVGSKGEGLVQTHHQEHAVFARVHTFGKACGCHGAVVLGSETLKTYLINFARSLMYSTALSPAAVSAIQQSYRLFPSMEEERKHLKKLIELFQNTSTNYTKLNASTPIQGVIVPGNVAVKNLAKQIQDAGFDVRPILYPTVPKGEERLRIVLHSFNTDEQLNKLLNLLK